MSGSGARVEEEEEEILALGLSALSVGILRRRINYGYAELRLSFNFVFYQSAPSKSGRADLLPSPSFSLFYLCPSPSLSLSPRYPIIECRSHVKEKSDPIIYFLPSPSARCRRRGSVPFCVKLRWISRNKPKSRMEV